MIPMQFGFEDDGKVKREFESFEECYNEQLKGSSVGGDVYKGAEANFKK